MTLYDVNKSAYSSVPDITKDQLEDAIVDISNFMSTTNHRYFMLLSNDRRDYTVFHIPDPYSGIGYKEAAGEVVSLLEERHATFKGIDFESPTCVDFWVMIDSECFLYKLFGYDWGVIKIG